MPQRRGRGGAAAGQRGTKSSSAQPCDEVDVELLKAVAQAWHAQLGNPRPSSRAAGDDSDAGVRRRDGAAARRRPSRFKLEAMAAAANASAPPPREEAPWDFAQSLLDTYELVAVARRLESGLVVADQVAGSAATDVPREQGKRGRESGRSLRSLLLRSTPRRFGEASS
ncbi:hypothetical protein HU200_039061 [Digitaria exilis]|uniref:Uncharacterized protein n=1 Tax=Digitaria exilis TaxID=1010633 RepID=A0A835BJV3_9POAL|nr:hypothetical protein HU200_039061 [Digitaria exilis]CAB3450235.1 unnamed protein product [Digitaria exilis]